MRHRSVMTTAAAVAAILFLGIFFPRSAGAMLPQPAEKAVMLSVTAFSDSSGVTSRYTEDPAQISHFLSELSRIRIIPSPTGAANPHPACSYCFTIYYKADMTFFELTEQGDICWNGKQCSLFGSPAALNSLFQLSERWTQV